MPIIYTFQDMVLEYDIYVDHKKPEDEQFTDFLTISYDGITRYLICYYIFVSMCC